MYHDNLKYYKSLSVEFVKMSLTLWWLFLDVYSHTKTHFIFKEQINSMNC